MRARALGASVLLSTLSTCTRAPEPEPLPPSPVLEVEYAGCQEVRPGPLCELAEGATLTVWAQGPAGVTLELGVDVGAPSDAQASGGEPRGSWVPAVRTTTEATPGGGTRWRLVVPAEARAVVVRGSATGAATRVVIPLGRRDLPAALAEVDRLRAGGQFAEAEAALAPLLDDPRPDVRTRVLGKRARLAMAQGRLDEAFSHFHAAIERARAEGLRATELNDRAALGYALLYSAGRFADADAALRPLEALAREVPQGRTTAWYFLGLLDHDVGDVRGAAEELGRARAQAERLGQTREAQAALEMEIDALFTLGQDQRARELVTRLPRADEAVGPCDRARVAHNRALYAMFRGGDAQLATTADTLAHLEEAVRLTEDACPNPTSHEQYSASLVRALVQSDRLAEARGVLARFARLESSDNTALLRADAEVALASADHRRALRSYARLKGLAADIPHLQWVSAVGMAAVHQALGQADEAIAELRSAEDSLDSYTLLIPYGGGRATFLDTYARSSDQLVALLLRQGRTAEAWQVARAGRRRGIASLAWRANLENLPPAARARWHAALQAYYHARGELDREVDEDWKLASRQAKEARARRAARLGEVTATLDREIARIGPLPSALEVPPFAHDELVILVRPTGASTTLFAQRAGELRVITTTITFDADQASLSRAILDPITDWLEETTRLQVLASGPFAAVDVHALPYRGQPLIARVPVVYGLDLGLHARTSTTAAAETVLVVADPTGDLPQAQAEADTVARAAQRRGRPVRMLLNTQATRDGLLRELEAARPSTLHLASHARYASDDSRNSTLRLAHDTTLSVSDILALPYAPAHVVLAGCETGREPVAQSVALSIGHAWLLAGSRAVIVSNRPIADADAARLTAALYTTFDFQDLPRSLADAQRALYEASPGTDWASFRVMVP